VESGAKVSLKVLDVSGGPWRRRNNGSESVRVCGLSDSTPFWVDTKRAEGFVRHRVRRLFTDETTEKMKKRRKG